MIYKCKICGFIHEGDMPDGYFCPLCHGSFYDFEIISNETKKYNRVRVNKSNLSIQRITEKCINCGACKKTCENIVGIKKNNVCINCGQCILTCPKGALTPKYNYHEVKKYIDDPKYKVAVITSPAVRVGIGDAYGYKPGEFLEGQMVGALKAIGFDYVFDTTFGADLTSMEEAFELGEHIKNGKTPMFSSCCPSWVKYATIFHPELIKNISTCKSPIGMESTIIKKYYAKEEGINVSKLILVALTPCTSKKTEIVDSNTDFVITTSELNLLLEENNVDFNSVPEAKFDSINGSSSGTIYGVSGGVTTSVLRVLFHNETGRDLSANELLILNKKYYKEYRVKVNKRIIKCAAVSGLPNLEKLLKEDQTFDFIEVMNCLGGCLNGGGQILMPPVNMDDIRNKRGKSLMQDDNNPILKYPYKNDLIEEVYNDLLDKPGSPMAIKLLHTKIKKITG